MSVRELLGCAARRLREAGTDSPRREARLLLAVAMGVARPEDLLTASRQPSCEERARFEAFLARRVLREPLAYITGRKEFWSLELAVGAGVMVPRPETEILIETARQYLEPDGAFVVGDLGTGSGAILTAALTEFLRARGIGFERSADALVYAGTNLTRHGLQDRAEILATDWDQAPAWRFDALFCNPPYIPTEEIESLEPEVRLYEPRAALDGGADGLAAYRSLGNVLPMALKAGGLAFVELGFGQAPLVEPLFQKLTILDVAPDLAGIPRVLVLKRPK